MWLEFESYLQDRGSSPKTIRGYLNDLKQFATWFEITNGQVLEPGLMTPIDGREYRQYLIAIKKSRPATTNRHLAALHSLGEWAVKVGEVGSNPFSGIKKVEQQALSPKWLDRREQAALQRLVDRQVNAAQTDIARMQAIRDRCILIVLLNTGLRIGEFTQLEETDIQMTDRKGELWVRKGKGDKSRNIPLNDTARRVLKEWMVLKPKSPLLFTGQRGPLKIRAVELIITELGRLANVEVTPHRLRHTFGKSLVDSGVSLEKVAALLGHSSLNTTRIYITPSQADLEKAVNMLD